MNIFTRLFFVVSLVVTTVVWTLCLRAYPGLLSKGNIASVVASAVLFGLYFYGFWTKVRQTFWKTMMILLTLATLVTLVKFLSNETFVLAALIFFGLLSFCGVLYEEHYSDKLQEIKERAVRNKHQRELRALQEDDIELPEFLEDQLT